MTSTRISPSPGCWPAELNLRVSVSRSAPGGASNMVVMAVAAAAAPACFSPRRIEGGTPSRRTSHRDSRRCRARTSVGRYSWARYYHPGLARFISEDPIGFAGGDVNFYAYAGNSPVVFVDPFGLDKDKCASNPEATRVFFTGLQFSGLIGGLYGPDRRGFGKQATYGIAWEQGTLNFRVFKSVGTANLEDPEGVVTGINLGIGLVVPLSHIRGSFRDFGGESIEESTGYGVVQLTDITTSSGRQGRSGSVNVGPSVAATRLRTVTTFYGCPR